jgi:hypothetical protein
LNAVEKMVENFSYWEQVLAYEREKSSGFEFLNIRVQTP